MLQPLKKTKLVPLAHWIKLEPAKVEQAYGDYYTKDNYGKVLEVGHGVKDVKPGDEVLFVESEIVEWDGDRYVRSHHIIAKR